MEHRFTSTLAAALYAAAAFVSFAEEPNERTVEGEKNASTQLPCPALNIPMATDDAVVKQEIELGLVDMLLGWEESAQLHFARAIQAGSSTENMSLMAYCGMMLMSATAGEKDANRMYLLEYIETVPTTPVELFYLNTFLRLACGDVKGAAEDFAARAERYKRDKFSALWACMLFHCVEEGYDITGRPNPYQERALKMASALYAEYPDDALVCYVRAYIEEASPRVSPEALEAAQKAVLAMPQHPMPALLYGHLLYRSERVEEALPYLHAAAQLAENTEIRPEYARLKTIAALYESTALWSARKTKEALAMRRSMNAAPPDRALKDSPSGVLYRWETTTLPLRVLVLRATPPDIADIKAAANAATPNPAWEEDDPVLLVRDCLRAALYARARMKQNDRASAEKSLALARESFKKFEATRESVFKRGNQYITPWYRAHEACRIAILAAGGDVFPDPDAFWKKVAESATRPANMLMPPPLPKQFGPEPTPQPAPKAKPKKPTSSSKKKKSSRKRK